MEALMDLSSFEQPDGQTPPPVGPGDAGWESELKRAIDDIGHIAQDRAAKLVLVA